MPAPLSKLDQIEIRRFKQLIRDGAVTYAHRKMDTWLRHTASKSLHAKRAEAVKAIKDETPLPVLGA